MDGVADGIMECCATGDAGIAARRGGLVDVGGVSQVEDEADEGFVALPGCPLQGGDAVDLLDGEFVEIGGDEEGEVLAGLEEPVRVFGGEAAGDEVEYFVGEVEEIHCGGLEIWRGGRNLGW